MTNEELLLLGQDMFSYCRKFNIPLEHLFQILEDQKVTPMIRGKAMEYNAFLKLDNLLTKSEWSVQKLNLNAQSGLHDEDISITHRRTGTILKVESKSAVRGSFADGAKGRKLRMPHFKVKSHRSRSNVKLANTSNDRYSVDCFDVLLTNPTNAIFQEKTISEGLEILHNKNLQKLLREFYAVDTNEELISACGEDWRFVIPADIAEAGFIPRTPYVKMMDDPNWRPLEDLEARLLQVVQRKIRQFQASSRRN